MLAHISPAVTAAGGVLPLLPSDTEQLGDPHADRSTAS